MSVGSDTKAVRARSQDDASLCASHADLTTPWLQEIEVLAGGRLQLLRSDGLTFLS
jgi:hypothetical protein